VRRLRAALKIRGSFATADLLERALESVDAGLTWWIDDLLAKSQGLGDGGVAHASTTNGRDEALAANVVWLSEKRYPGKKIILWAASLHLLKSHDAIETPPRLDYRGMHTMGELLGDRLVSFACIADEGKVSHHGYGSEAIDAPPADSIESMLTEAGFEHALLDLHATGPNAAWLHTAYMAGPLGYVSMRNRWDVSFDGFVFSRHMDASFMVPDATADAGVPDGGAANRSP
jgi:hypothetical protein